MLVPAAVLVLVILGAIAVDSATAFLGQRELAGAAAAAANDAATAISPAHFYRSGGGAEGAVAIDDDRARRVAERAVSARAPRGVEVTAFSVEATRGQVCVTIVGRVEYVFAKAVPGVARHTTVQARAEATAVEGPAGSPLAPRQVC